jgi:hypothetical protein
MLPIAGDDIRSIQWRCHLVGGQHELPRLVSASIDFNPEPQELAQRRP